MFAAQSMQAKRVSTKEEEAAKRWRAH